MSVHLFGDVHHGIIYHDFRFSLFLGSQGQVPPSDGHRQTEVLHKRGAGVEEKGEEVSLSECRHLESR